MRWTFLAPGLSRPAGGAIALFEVVNALARAGDQVHVLHVPTTQGAVRAVGDLPWVQFDPAVEHRFDASLDSLALPAADVLVYTTMVVATAVADGGAPLLGVLEQPGGPWGAPVLFLQGHGVFPPELERLAATLPGLKVCVGAWLADLLVAEGVPAADVVHIANGLDPETFRLRQPIEGRPPGTAMSFDPYPVKGGAEGLEALGRVATRTGAPGVLFGTRPPERRLADGLSFVSSPRQTEIASTIYGRAAVYLQPSRREGFGMCAVESMACGCALVTTANGGSAEYAIHEETALVCGGSPDEMADAVVRLLQDDPLRVRLATNGLRYVARFRWTVTAQRLQEAVRRRLGPPSGRPRPSD